MGRKNSAVGNTHKLIPFFPGQAFRGGALFKTWQVILSALLTIGMVTQVKAEQPYPSKPIQLVVAYPAGGGTDILARVISTELAKMLDQPIVVLNRPGASGAIGTTAVARAKPDGYTLLLDTGNVTLRPAVDPTTGFSSKDFVPVALVTESALALVVPQSLPVASLSELLDYSRSHPGTINYASTGHGSPQNVMGELLKKRAGVDWQQVTYQGGAPALLDLNAGRVHVMFSNPVPLMPYLKGKKLHALAVTSKDRLPGLDNVPTMSEQGQNDFVVSFWNGFLAPAGTPAPVVKKLSDAIMKVMQLPQVRNILTQQGSILAPLDESLFKDYVQKDEERWRNIVAFVGQSAVK
jgi:tripartite-type tricarboxylate transporter receptor subunit TctC